MTRWPLHFPREELAAAAPRVQRDGAARGLDGLLMFRQESMYYLTGYDTFGYVFFQCLYLGADGRMTLLTRAPDLLQAQHTSVIEDIRIWVDAPDAKPGRGAARRSSRSTGRGQAPRRRVGGLWPDRRATASGWRRRSTASRSSTTPPTWSRACGW